MNNYSRISQVMINLQNHSYSSHTWGSQTPCPPCLWCTRSRAPRWSPGSARGRSSRPGRRRCGWGQGTTTRGRSEVSLGLFLFLVITAWHVSLNITFHSWHITLDMLLLTCHSKHSWHASLDMSLLTCDSTHVTLDMSVLTSHSWHVTFGMSLWQATF